MVGRVRKNIRFALRVVWLLTKGFVLALGLAILALGAALYFHPNLIDADRVRALLVSRLEEVFLRPVTIQRLIVTPQGIKLHGLRVASKDDPSQSLIESDFALLTVKLQPLLERRVELSQVKLSAPRLRVFRDEAGEWSFADIFMREEAHAPRAPLPVTVSLAADETVIENGTLKVDDRLLNRSYVIERFNLRVQRFSADHPFLFALAFDNVTRLGERALSTGLKMEGTAFLAGFDWERAYLRARSAEFRLAGRGLKGHLALAGYPRTKIDAEWDAPPLGPADWEAALTRPFELNLPAARWKLSARRSAARELEVESLAVEAPPLSARAAGRVSWEPGAQRAEAELALGDFPLEQAAAFRPGLEPFALKGVLAGEASVAGWTDRLVVSKAAVRTRGLQARFAHASVRGGDADLAATHEFSRVSVRVTRGAVDALGSGFTEVRGRARLEKNELALEDLAFKWNGGLVRLRARVVDVSDPREVALLGCAATVRWEDAQELVENAAALLSTGSARPPEAARRPWVQTFKYAIPKRFPDTVGELRVEQIGHRNFSFAGTDLRWYLRGVSPDLNQVSGDVRVGFGPGRVTDVSAVQDAHKFLRIVFLPYIYMHKMNNLSVLSAATAYPKTLDFHRIEAQYAIREGVVSTRFFHVDSPQLLAYADGSADFARERVDMNILTRLTAYRAPLPEWWVDQRGRPAIGFRVKGNLNRPELEPRLQKMGGDEIERAAEAGRQRAQERFGAMAALRSLGAQGGLQCR